MKLILKNFKCYENRTFTIPDNSITLINAPSGKGKSSICCAINFALYGIGNKVVMHDKTTCSVELHLDNVGYIIKRSKRPNHLTLQKKDGTTYSDDGAQEIINEYFGNSFDITGYLEQNSTNSFILMTPANKSEFLERFAFKGINLSEIKDKTKLLIKNYESELLKAQSQLSLLTKMRDEITVVDKVLFPIKCKKESEDLVEKNENVRLKNCSVKIKKIDSLISSLQKDKTDILVKNSNLLTLNNQLDSIVKEINIQENELKQTLENQKSESYINELNSKLEKIKIQKQINQLNETINELQLQIENTQKREQEANKKKLEMIEELTSIVSDYDGLNLDELYNILSSIFTIKRKLPKTINYIEDINKMTHSLSQLEKERDDTKHLIYKFENQLTILTCPSCSSLLRLNEEDDLILADNPNLVDSDDLVNDIEICKKLEVELNSKIIKLRKDIEIAKNILSEYQKMKGYISSFREIIDIDEEEILDESYLNEFQDIINKYKKLELLKSEIKNKNTNSTSSLEDMINKKKKELVILGLSNFTISDDDTEESVQKELYEVMSSLSRVKDMKNKLENYFYKQRDGIKEKIEILLSSTTESKTINEIEDELKQLQKEKIELNDASILHQKNIDLISKYKEYKKYIERVESIDNQVNELKHTEKLYLSRLTGANKLKDIISEAESLSVAGLISSINTHARIYLDDFFPENPISVLLQPFKETKKATKSQINVEIEYKEMSCGLDTLSGGEVARVALAYTLALAEMVNTPILMLDECTSSLDAEMSNAVIESIQKHMPNKTIIMIAHQAETGAYDNVITI